MMAYDINYFNELISDSKLYYAHLPKEGDNERKKELLSEHSALVYSYAKKIVEKQLLDSIIENLIINAIPDNLDNKQLLAKEIDTLFWRAIAFHDLGKVNRIFQKKKMKNDADILHVEHDYGSQHSVISVYIFLAFYYEQTLSINISENNRDYLDNVALYLSYSIYMHHSTILIDAQYEDQWTDHRLVSLSNYLTLFGIQIQNKEDFHNCILQYAVHGEKGLFGQLERILNEKYNSCFPLFALIKLNYSLLTASDYLATAHYMNNWEEMFADFNLIDNSLRNKIITNAVNFEYNKPVYDTINKREIISPDLYAQQSNANLNELRKCIAVEVVENIRKNSDKSLFYIEAPTGGGKTNVSMLALAELLSSDANGRISKVFYVFPFTTLITQTYKSLSETLGLSESEIAEIHSKAPFQTKYCEDDYLDRSNYLNYLDNLFMNYPVVLLSHIRFFDVLKANHKETNYLLHRMANSVVIIDEIQSYSPKIWDKIVYFIVNYAKYFNIKFIVMSATLPKIGNIVNNKELAHDFVYLVNDKNKYFQNSNFCNRVSFDYSLLTLPIPDKDNKCDYLRNLMFTVFEKSTEYSRHNSLYPDSVFTIVEFIFKKTASEFYLLVLNENIFFDEIYLLSGTILEPRRKEIIRNLKSEKIRDKKVLLISTQVVEAGVDIDMDLGFKDKSIIDSEEQLAGRINRNVKKKGCTLYIFDCDTEKTLYAGDERYKLLKGDINEYQNILQTKDFDKLYNLVIDKIISKNEKEYIQNLSELLKKVSKLDFKGVNDELRIITAENISIFVPLSIDIRYFEQFIGTLNDLNIPYHEMLQGKDVWNCYESVIKNQDEDFVKNKIQMKKLQGLMSNFVFSIFPTGEDARNLISSGYGRMVYGFLYLENYNEIYSFENGINTDVLKNSNFI